MSGTGPAETKDAMLREAATWLARMRGPDAEAHRDALEAWLAGAPTHRAAYNRATEVFALGKLITEPRPAPAARRPERRALAAALAALLAAGLAIAWVASRPALPGGTEGATAAVTTRGAQMLATAAGETRTERLADGSLVALGAGSRLRAEFGPRERIVTLLRGEGRFDVRHDGRSFIVQAGGGRIIARGTVFTVACQAGEVEVRLLEGAVDVVMPGPPGGAVRQLRPGERLRFAARAAMPARVAADAPRAAGAATELAAVPLGELVARGTRAGGPVIRLEGEALAGRRVSGRLRLDDPERLARQLALLLDLELEQRPGEIVLRARDPGA